MTTDDDDDYQCPQTLLPVASTPVGNPSLPPLTGPEYLRRVRAEADSLSLAIVHTIPTSLTKLTAPSEQLTSKPKIDHQWATRILALVEPLHNQINCGVRGMTVVTDQQWWYKLLYVDSKYSQLCKIRNINHFAQSELLTLVQFHTCWIKKQRNLAQLEHLFQTVFCILLGVHHSVLDADQVWIVRCLGVCVVDLLALLDLYPIPCESSISRSEPSSKIRKLGGVQQVDACAVPSAALSTANEQELGLAYVPALQPEPVLEPFGQPGLEPSISNELVQELNSTNLEPGIPFEQINGSDLKCIPVDPSSSCTQIPPPTKIKISKKRNRNPQRYWKGSYNEYLDAIKAARIVLVIIALWFGQRDLCTFE